MIKQTKRREPDKTQNSPCISWIWSHHISAVVRWEATGVLGFEHQGEQKNRMSLQR